MYITHEMKLSLLDLFSAQMLAAQGNDMKDEHGPDWIWSSNPWPSLDLIFQSIDMNMMGWWNRY